MAALLEKLYDVRFTLESLGPLDDLHEKMVLARQASPEKPWEWLGMHYNYFTINGSTLLDGTDNDKYPTLKLEDMASFCKKYNLEELPMLFN